MRTTLEIDDDVLLAAKELAEAQRTGGKVLSDLARKALGPARRSPLGETAFRYCRPVRERAR